MNQLVYEITLNKLHSSFEWKQKDSGEYLGSQVPRKHLGPLSLSTVVQGSV